MSSSTFSDPIYRTWNHDPDEIRIEIAEEVDQEQPSYSHVRSETLKKILERFEFPTYGRKFELINLFRSEHPELDGSRTAKNLSVSEMREILASLERREVFGDE